VGDDAPVTEPADEPAVPVPALSAEVRAEARRVAEQVGRGDFSGLPTWEEVAAELGLPI